MTSANNQSGVEKNCNISKENVSLENEKTNYINSDCSLTCRSQNKHGRVNLNVQTNTSELDCYNCHMRQGTCLCHPDPKLNNASYASVPMALANDALPDLGCTLQAILTELKIINRNTSQINVLSNNMQEFIQAEKLTNIQPLKPLHDKISDVKFDSISSLDWTYEQKKWLTPKKEDNRQKLLQNLNPIHSTPVPRDPVIMDLQDIFNNITTGSTINMTQNSSFSLSQKTNEIAFNDGKELQHRENNESLSHENQTPLVPGPSTRKPIGTTMPTQIKEFKTRDEIEHFIKEIKNLDEIGHLELSKDKENVSKGKKTDNLNKENPHIVTTVFDQIKSCLAFLTISNLMYHDNLEKEDDLVVIDFPLDDVITNMKNDTPNDSINNKLANESVQNLKNACDENAMEKTNMKKILEKLPFLKIIHLTQVHYRKEPNLMI